MNVNNFSFIEGKNLIEIEGLKFKNKNFLSFKKINVKTPNNNFSVQNEKQDFGYRSKFEQIQIN